MPPTARTMIPNIVHWVSPGQNGEYFPYWTYVNAAAIVDVMSPDTFYFHHVIGCLPSGPWWDVASKVLTLVPHSSLEHVYGNTVSLLAHRSDVMRLAILVEYGGVYLDTDVLLLRNFSVLLHNDFVIGIQSPGRTANAVMLASKYAHFTVRWLDAYHNFSQHDWDRHSVRLPWTLAEKLPGSALWLPYTAWFDPGPDDDPAYELFERNVSQTASLLDNKFAHHLWHQICKQTLDSITGPSWFTTHAHTLYARSLKNLADSGNCPHVATALDT